MIALGTKNTMRLTDRDSIAVTVTEAVLFDFKKCEVLAYKNANYV